MCSQNFFYENCFRIFFAQKIFFEFFLLEKFFLQKFFTNIFFEFFFSKNFFCENFYLQIFFAKFFFYKFFFGENFYYRIFFGQNFSFHKNISAKIFLTIFSRISFVFDICEIMYFAKFFFRNFAYCEFFCFAILLYGKKNCKFFLQFFFQRWAWIPKLKMFLFWKKVKFSLIVLLDFFTHY